MKSGRSWKSRILELLIWAAVAILTAVLMVIFTEKLLPPNF